jgi:hypothetical protein
MVRSQSNDHPKASEKEGANIHLWRKPMGVSFLCVECKLSARGINITNCVTLNVVGHGRVSTGFEGRDRRRPEYSYILIRRQSVADGR